MISSVTNFKSFTRRAISLVVVLCLIVVGVTSIWSQLQPQPAQAAVAKFINFQGKLTQTSDGSNVANGNYSMQFKLYDALTSGTLLWTETWDGGTSQVTVTNGVFNVRLGTHTSLDTVDFTTANLYLTVNFNPGAGYDGEMSPRKRLVSSAFAFNANNVVGDGRLDLAYAPANATNPGGKIDYSPSVASSNNTLALVTGSNVSGASLNISTGGTGNGLDLAGAGTNSRTINSTGAALVLRTTTSGNITLSPASGIVAGSGALTIQSGGATALTLDAGGAAALQLGTTNANAITISRAGVGTTIQGTTVFNEAATVGNGSGNDYLAFASESSNPSCGAAQYRIWANSTDLKLKKCQNGTISDLDTTGGGGSPIFSSILAATGTNTLDNTNYAQTWQWSTLTTETGLKVSGGSAMTTGSVVEVGGATFVHTASNEVGKLMSLLFTDASTNANDGGVTSGLDILGTINTSGAGTKEINGLRIQTPNLTACTTGACTFNGIKFTGGTGALTNLTSYGLQVEAGSGSGTEYAAVFTGGNVGIGTTTPSDMLQVGQAGARGDLSVYGDIASKGYKSLKALANINDIFIYDTSADSDGGRWIDWPTTRSLSWYTEARDDGPDDICDITTDDRCDAAPFPKKAIIASTDNAVYIFDATSDSLWMKFTQTGTYAIGADTNNNPSGVYALNGVLYIATNGSASGGLYAFDFINDMMYNYDATDRSQGDKTIADRNTTVSYATNNITAMAIANSRVNDVAAAVMSGSTNTNAVNGITLVAATTDIGISMINVSAQRVLNYSDNTNDQYGAVYLTRRGFVYGMNATRGQVERWINIDVDQASELNGTPDRVWDETTVPSLAKTAPTITTGPDTLDVVERGSLSLDTADIIYAGHSLGLTEIHDNTTTVNSAWSKFYTTSGQTSFMPATIRAMLLMNESSGDLTDSSLRNNVFQSVGTATYGQDGVRGTSIAFNGTSNLFCSDTNNDNTCDVDTDYNTTTTGFTIQMWFKHSTSISGTDMLFNKCFTAAPAQAACTAIWMNSTGTMAFGIDDDATWTTTPGDDVATSTQTYNDGQWHHLVASRTNAAGNISLYIDGKLVGTDATLAATLTLDGSQIVSIGGDCSVGANCATGANFWDGSIDDVTLSMGGTTTTDQVTQIQARRLYNDARPTLADRSISVANGDIFSSTTIGATGQTWRTNEFIGQFVRIDGGTGVGQSRRVISNTATTLTVTPAWATTPDATTDFSITPSALYGSTNVVRAVGVTGRSPLGEARLMCVGTNDGSDNGAVTCYNHNAGPNVVAEIYHSDAAKVDDVGTSWTGTDYDDIRAIDLKATVEVFGSQAALWTESEDRRLGLSFDRVSNLLFDVRAELITDGITGTGLEVGLTGAADLAEYYYSDTELEGGDVVMIDKSKAGPNVMHANKTYATGLIGVVSTEPALVIGERTSNGYPIALSGRIPVKVSLENGPIFPGDQLTSSSRPGYAMKALSSGPSLGVALTGTPVDSELSSCPGYANDGNPTTPKCSVVTLFIQVGYYNGAPVEDLMHAYELAQKPPVDFEQTAEEALTHVHTGDALTGLEAELSVADRILAFLNHLKEDRNADGRGVEAEIFTDRVSALEIISPAIITKGLQTERIGTDGRKLGVFGDIVFFGRPYLTGDSAGFATIKQGQQQVDITFAKEYLNQPVISALITTEVVGDLANSEEVAKSRQQQNELAGTLFSKNTNLLVINKSVKGFTLLLKEPAGADMTISWISFAVKNPNLSSSDDDKQFNASGPSPIEEPVESAPAVTVDPPSSSPENESGAPGSSNDEVNLEAEPVVNSSSETESLSIPSSSSPSPATESSE